MELVCCALILMIGYFVTKITDKEMKDTIMFMLCIVGTCCFVGLVIAIVLK